MFGRRAVLVAVLCVAACLGSALARAQQFKILHSFNGNDGGEPTFLIQKPDGNVFGVTFLGGSDGFSGVLYKLDRAGSFSVVHNFTDVPDGSLPGRLLLGRDGNIYGLTSSGGNTSSGTVYRVDGQGNYTVLHAFNSQTEGSGPNFLMEASDGFFYGTASVAGVPDPNCPNKQAQGTFFRMDKAGKVTPLHTFCEDIDGSIPNSVVEVGGTFYGTCKEDGPLSPGVLGNGTIWSSDPAGNVILLRVFGFRTVDNAEPNQPEGLLLATDGLLYGVSNSGGAFSQGAIYRSDLAGNTTTIHSFNDLATDGADPESNFTLGRDGFFYGTASTGGLPVNDFSRSGVVYRADTNGNVWVLHTYRVQDGANPNAPAILARPAGRIYSTALSDGPSGSGTVGWLSSKANTPILNLTFNPNPVKGGNSTTATLVLSKPAPPGGQVVALTTNDQLTIPVSLTVPEGKSSATFSVGTFAVTATTDANVTASIKDVGVSGKVTIAP